MATVAIDMGDHTANVNIDGFETLSPADQQTQVDDVKASMAATNSAAPAAAAPAAPATGITDDLYAGASGAAEGLGNTIDTAATAAGYPRVAAAGKWLENALPADKNYVAPNLGQDIKDQVSGGGSWSQTGHDLLRSAAAGAAPTAAMLAGGAVAGPYGVAGAAGALNFGDNVTARAANNHEDKSSTDALLGGAATTAVQAGTMAAAGGLSEVGIPGDIIRAAPTLAKPLVAGGFDAAASGAGNAEGQVGQTADTDKGLSVDPYQVAGAAAQGGAARVASMAGGVAKAGVQAASDNVMSRMQPEPASPEQAQSNIRVNSYLDDATAAAKQLTGTTDQLTIANTVKRNLVNDAVARINDLQGVGVIDQGQARSAIQMFQRQALPKNNTITDQDGSLFNQINSWNAPDEIIGPIKNAALDLNTLAPSSFQNQANGPFRQLGSLAARGAAIGGAIYSGSPTAMIGSVLGLHGESKVGGAVGGALDSLMGTNTPNVRLQAMKSQRMLDSLGMDAGQSSFTGLKNIGDAVNDLRSAIPAKTGPGLNVGVQLPGASADPATIAADQVAATKLTNGPAYKPPSGDPWAAHDAATADAQAKATSFLSGVNLPGSSVDPLRGVPTLTPNSGPDGTADLSGQGDVAQANSTAVARSRAAFAARLANRKVDPDWLAQTSVDKSALQNQTKLTAGTTTPNPQDGVSNTAVDAAINTAMRGARGVMANASDGAADPVTGVRPDLVPVNTPLDRNNNPLEAPKASRAPAPAPMAQAVPAAPGGDPVASSLGIPQLGSPTSSAMSNGTTLEGFIANGNPAHTRAAVHAAIHAAYPDDAAAIIAHGERGGGIDRAVARNVQAKLKDISGSSEPTAAGGDQTEAIIRAAKIAASADGYHKMAVSKAAQARASGDHDVADAIEAVAGAHGATHEENVAAKQTALHKAIPDHHRRAATAHHFTHRLMTHGPRPKKG